jgi:osmotically-inducible protein OsmY
MITKLGRVALATIAIAGCTEHRISRAVDDRLAHDPKAALVHAHTRRQIVTLEGAVESADDRLRLVALVEDVPGVLGVEDRVVVRPPPNVTGAAVSADPKDREIERKLDAIFAESGLPGVTVQSVQGVVALHGEIPYGKRKDAVRIAAMADPGVKKVETYLVEY